MKLITLVVATTCAAGARAQTPSWQLVSSAQADLWFHGMGAVGLGGPGSLPLYDSADVARTRIAKEAGAVRTALDSLAASLHAELRGDTIFEVLHFLPLYFARSAPQDMLGALRRVAEHGRSPGPGIGPDERTGTYLAALLFGGAPEHRRVLGSLVDALEDEWTGFYRDYRERAVSRAAIAVADSAWQPLVVALRPYLAWAHLERGRILVSPALGPDGRIVAEPQDVQTGNVVAVWLPPDRPADAASFAVRELCYPAVRRVLEQVTVPSNRGRAEDLSGRAAVRCGELLLRRFAPDRAAHYREAWLRAANSVEPFETTFRVPAEVMLALERTLEF